MSARESSNEPTTEPSNEPRSTIRLPDGRALSYLEAGDPSGTPIFHFHGHGSSRLEALLVAEQAAAQGVRLIALDRPGLGGSDPLPDGNGTRRVLLWPDDVAATADALGIERFAVLGISGGAPYALACAYKIPARLIACGIVSAVPPCEAMRKAGAMWARAVWTLAAWFPKAFQNWLNLTVPGSVSTTGRMAPMMERRLWRAMWWLTRADLRTLQRREVRMCLARALAEGHRQGGKAVRDETLGMVHPWGFTVQEIQFPRIFVWHGEKDRVMTVAPMRLVAKMLPHCSATFYPDEGHFSVPVNHAQEILRALRS